MSDYIERFRLTVDRAAEVLGQLSESSAAQRPAPGKWSPKEVIGHLIDSACNNHGRFVRAGLSDEMIFPGYDQDAWVAIQRYQSESWHALLTLWRAYNLHLSMVMDSIPKDVRLKPRARHNLQIGRASCRERVEISVAEVQW